MLNPDRSEPEQNRQFKTGLRDNYLEKRRNEEHRHSRIRFVTPNERHRGEDKALLAKRDAVYQAA